MPHINLELSSNEAITEAMFYKKDSNSIKYVNAIYTRGVESDGNSAVIQIGNPCGYIVRNASTNNLISYTSFSNDTVITKDYIEECSKSIDKSNNYLNDILPISSSEYDVMLAEYRGLFDKVGAFVFNSNLSNEEKDILESFVKLYAKISFNEIYPYVYAICFDFFKWSDDILSDRIKPTFDFNKLLNPQKVRL